MKHRFLMTFESVPLRLHCNDCVSAVKFETIWANRRSDHASNNNLPLREIILKSVRLLWKPQ